MRADPRGSVAVSRVDLILDAADRPVVLELELTEPSVFLLHDAGSADCFARVIIARAR